MTQAIPNHDVDPREPAERLLRDLRSRRQGLTQREAERRLIAYGPNELRRRGHRSRSRQLVRQLTHPLALLLWGAAMLAWLGHTPALAAAIVAVIVVNALFAFLQEQQAERAVEMLSRYLPPQAKVIRDGEVHTIDARALVPGDLLVLEEGDGISADARLLEGSLEVDVSALTGESLPTFRSAELIDTDVSFFQARDLVFSGTTCTGGEARAVVFATGMHTELGRIAALTERVRVEESPLEHQVRRVAWLIAVVAALVGAAFLPLGTLAAGLSLPDASLFSIGLLVSNVPEGLLPTITLALAVGVRTLARRGALVKRLSAVETLGSTTVICTDKTGTLTENRMQVTQIWTQQSEVDVDHVEHRPEDAAFSALLETVSACNTATVHPGSRESDTGDPTDVALLIAAANFGQDVETSRREAHRRRFFHFDPALRLISSLDEQDRCLVLHTKGAPEAVLQRSTRVLDAAGHEQPLGAPDRERIAAVIDDYARRGLRVIGVARRRLEELAIDVRRNQVERDLCILGLVALFDPPRPEVAAAVARCHTAGIRVIVVTGDHALTAVEMARRVGIEAERVVSDDELDAMSEATLDELLARHREIVFARNSPEAKLRVADALRAQGEVVAMTGDGVNDAPALRRADIGVAMGHSGTDVAREAATMILTDDNFATIVTAVQEGRRIYDNVRKFIFYIFAHATPEVVPFLVFALSGGAVPLPLTVLQILAIDLGTETLPALALGREPAEPGLMERPPRSRSEGVIQAAMLVRAWLFLGVISAALAMAGFFAVLGAAGWWPGAEVGPTSHLHHAYRQATTMTFLGIVACQIGTALAARTEHAALNRIGLTTNPLLLWGIGFEVLFAAVVTWVPPLQAIFDTAPPPTAALPLLCAYPVIVWGSDELRRYFVRRKGGRESPFR